MSDEEEISRLGRRKVVSINPRAFRQATPRVQELTIADLELLESVAKGEASPGGTVAKLDVDDLRSLDDAFQQARLEATNVLAKHLKEGETLTPEEAELFDGISCCCCTPCCCCAAADVDPFE